MRLPAPLLGQAKGCFQGARRRKGTDPGGNKNLKEKRGNNAQLKTAKTGVLEASARQLTRRWREGGRSELLFTGIHAKVSTAAGQRCRPGEAKRLPILPSGGLIRELTRG